jgi:hypothetical protein
VPAILAINSFGLYAAIVITNSTYPLLIVSVAKLPFHMFRPRIIPINYVDQTIFLWSFGPTLKLQMYSYSQCRRLIVLSSHSSDAPIHKISLQAKPLGYERTPPLGTQTIHQKQGLLNYSHCLYLVVHPSTK